jgi:hypothetical protein
LPETDPMSKNYFQTVGLPLGYSSLR